MKGDFSKLRFRPHKQYTSVLHQQGRVALDADANEQRAIDAYLRDTETQDFIGRWGGPADDCGFQITVQDGAIHISRGRYYVEGVLCENDQQLSYSDQHHLINPSPTDSDLLGELSLGSISTIQVYLEVWQRLVTALDDPCLREPALGQADTTARLQTVWRVIAQGVIPPSSAAPQPPALLTARPALASAVPTGTLDRAVLLETPASASLGLAGVRIPSPGPLPRPVPVPQSCCAEMDNADFQQGPQGKLNATTGGSAGECSCQPTPAAGYVGLENQLYRVEIHESGDENTATFKWSRENGSVVVAITGGVPGTQIQVSSLGPDSNLGFGVGQWVEITDDTNLFGPLPNQPGQLYQIAAIDPQNLIITTQQVVAGVDPQKNARLRRWDQFGLSATTNGVAISTASLPLENGIQLQFSPGNYVSGDYWLIPARTATGNIEWPPNDPCDCDGNVFRPPHRIKVWRAPLACIEWQSGQATVYDCRNQFDNLVELSKRSQTCCTVVVNPQDLTGGVTLQSMINQAANPTMLVEAVTPGAIGNNVAVEISNLKQNVPTPTFDLTVTETDVYRGLTTGGATGIEGVIGDEESNLPNAGPLAHILVGSVNPNGSPEDDQEITLTGGEAGAAQGNIVDGKKQLVFTLQARSSGAEGNRIRAKISNLDATQNPPTFDLTLAWSKTLRGLSLATLFQQIRSTMSYEIVATAPVTVPAALPAEGVTWLSGGVDAGPDSGSAALKAHAGIFGNPGKVCLRPGTYHLSAPVTLGPEQSNITIESCGGTAILSAALAWGAGEDLPQGLLVLDGANNVTLLGLCFSMPPPVRLVAGRTFLKGLSAELLQGIIGSIVPGGSREVARLLGQIYVSVGLRPVQCANLRVQDCTFEFRTEAGVLSQGTLMQAGVLASGANSGLNLLENHFEAHVNPILTSNSFLQIRAGYLLTPSVILSSLSRLAASRIAVKGSKPEPQPKVHEEGTLVSAALRDAFFQGNVFEGLEIPFLVFSECETVVLEDNTMKDCYAGPWLLARRSRPDATKVTGEPEPAGDVLQDPVFKGALALAQCFPLPPAFATPPAVTVPSANIVLSRASFQNPILALLDGVLQLEFGLWQGASISAATFSLSLHGVNNRIATYPLPAWADSTGPGLVIWGEDNDSNTEVILSFNRIENSSAPVMPTALIVQVQNVAMTGNLILNDNGSTLAGSLYLGPLPPTLTPSIAVTGNLFNSNTNLSSLVSPASQTVGIGNNSITLFNSTLAHDPIQPNSVKVFAGGSQVGADSGGGTITGNAGFGLHGTIDYESGASSLTFTSPPASGVAVAISYLYSKWASLNGP